MEMTWKEMNEKFKISLKCLNRKKVKEIENCFFNVCVW